jgi:hypothetical protein
MTKRTVDKDDIEKFLWAYDRPGLDTARDIVKYFLQHDLMEGAVERIADVALDKHRYHRAIADAGAMGEEIKEKTFKKSKCGKKKADPIPESEVKEPIIRDKIPHIVIGTCPKCESLVRGMPVAHCETEKSGRTFYKECSACTYYSEIFNKRNKFYEVEGG